MHVLLLSDIPILSWLNSVFLLFLLWLFSPTSFVWPQVVDLQAQLSYFKNLIGLLRQKLGDADARALLGRALYLFSIGTNDYVAPFATNSSGLLSYSREEYVDMVIGNLTIVIKVTKSNMLCDI